MTNNNIQGPGLLQCPHCLVENRNDRYYCYYCGQAMFWLCADCGLSNYYHERFCGGCGHSLARQSPGQASTLISPAGSGQSERRQVTVLFCDVVGYTALFGRFDPEDMQEVIRQYQGIVVNVIVQFSGYTARIFGDGIMAYFGFPLAHEDAARRAVNAGLAIKQQVQQIVRIGPDRTEGLQIRIGIATGMVVAGDIVGQGAAQQYSLVGEAPNLAARIQGLAQPDTVVVAQSTRALLGRYFSLDHLGEFQVSGFNEPVKLYQVLRFKERISRFDAYRDRGPGPVVGRDPEIHRIANLISRHQDMRLTLVAIQGEAGIGKSRLLRECLYSNSGQPGYFKLHYQCSPSQQNTPLYPILEQLGQILKRYLDNTLETTIRLRLDIDRRSFWQDRVVQQWLAEGGNGSGHQTGAEEFQELLIHELVFFSRGNRIMVIFEDIHWADPSTIELIKRVLIDHKDLPLMIFVTYRDSYVPHWPAGEQIEHIKLSRLNQAETRQLISNITEDARLPARLVRDIAAKTAGIPFFAEQLSRTVLNTLSESRQQDGDDSDIIEQVYIPSTLHDMLMSKLDMLGEAKEVVQIAAVIGPQFSFRMLVELTVRIETELGFLLENAMFNSVIEPGAEAGLYIFCHALLQDAAYESLLKSKRRFYHAKIADILVAESGEQTANKAELIASHFALADNHSRAIEYLLVACDRALHINANRELVNLASQGLELVQHVSGASSAEFESTLQIYLGVGFQALKGLSCPESENAYIRTRELSTGVAGSLRLLDALVGLHTCYHIRGDLGLARKVHDAARQAISDSILWPGHPYVDFMEATNYFWGGDYANAHCIFQRSLANHHSGQHIMGIFQGIIKLRPMVLANLSWILWLQGRSAAAQGAADEAMALVDEFDQPITLGACLFLVGVTRVYCGRDQGVSQLLAKSANLSRHYEQAYLNAIMRVVEATFLINRGDTGKGFAIINRAVSSLGTLKAGIGLPWALTLSAEALLRQGKLEEAESLLKRAMDRARSHREFHWLAEIHRLNGCIQVSRGEPGQADQHFETARQTAIEQGARALELRACIELAQLYINQGRRESANLQLRAAMGNIDDRQPTPDLIKAEKILAAVATS